MIRNKNDVARSVEIRRGADAGRYDIRIWVAVMNGRNHIAFGCKIFGQPRHDRGIVAIAMADNHQRMPASSRLRAANRNALLREINRWKWWLAPQTSGVGNRLCAFLDRCGVPNIHPQTAVNKGDCDAARTPIFDIGLALMRQHNRAKANAICAQCGQFGRISLGNAGNARSLGAAGVNWCGYQDQKWNNKAPYHAINSSPSTVVDGQANCWAIHGYSSISGGKVFSCKTCWHKAAVNLGMSPNSSSRATT